MEPNGQRRVRRKDDPAEENGNVSLISVGEELDPWTAWAYRPRTVSLLLIGACFLMCVPHSVSRFFLMIFWLISQMID